MANTYDESKKAIDRIQAIINQLQSNLDQELPRGGKHNWPEIGSLNEVARQLEQADSFWRGLED